MVLDQVLDLVVAWSGLGLSFRPSPLREVVYEDSGLSKDEVDRILDMKAMTEGGVL